MKHHVTTVGIDLANKIFHLVGTDPTGKIVWRKQLTRHALLPFMAQLPPVTIGLEACCGAHYWARQLRHQGHQVKLMAPQFVKPYVKSNKNDRRDAEAIAEAVTRPTMRFVPSKDVDQQDLQARHRVRERRIGERTALINEVHGLMHEYGIVRPNGVSKFRQAVVEKLESEKDKLTALSQEMCGTLVKEFVALEEQIASYQEKLDTLAKTHPECQRLMTIPGIGPITATALVAAVGDVGVLKNSRQLAAWMGLVPKQHSTGGQHHLLGISQRGDRSLRKQLIHGARATLRGGERRTDKRRQWIRGLLKRRGWNRTAVAVANKHARIVWALLRRGGVYSETARRPHRVSDQG
ncbi:MAG TPA: IS110 family transposase [Gammaproteobacteria bacterium]|jgi:transposase|nr:IS110 family transposase [Gammaproteobacteria bacterium]